ncbi:hypothetical protein RB614_23225 [Phytohabitans sp. ZYX-F-186]|uniref:Peptidase M50 domain-containing protein n=1 Tax=Phytohabitans maris TaxID=3071409 RepID=A0ABU0ZM20_9ACTN|nr:hypothetical protein [Phytohabitans sp. ZYX-F-186]MDQ7907434.1 hypothetical protein [Phytohabitans sp. ZYX-F-186]
MTLYFLPLLVPALGLTVVSVFAGWILATVLAGSVLLIWASLVAHEAGHVLALRLLAPTAEYAHTVPEAPDAPVPANIVVDRRGAGVHRPQLRQRWREALVILAGPLFPAVVWAAVMAGIQLFSGAVPIAAMVWTGVVAWAHPASLLIPVGDAWSLIRLWRSRSAGQAGVGWARVASGRGVGERRAPSASN